MKKIMVKPKLLNKKEKAKKLVKTEKIKKTKKGGKSSKIKTFKQKKRYFFKFRRKNRIIGIFFKLYIPSILICISVMMTLYTYSHTKVKSTIINNIKKITQTLSTQTVTTINGDELATVRTKSDVIKNIYVNVSNDFNMLKQDKNLKHLYTIYFEDNKFYYGIDTESVNKQRSFPGTEINYPQPNRPDINTIKKGKTYTDNEIVYNEQGEAIIASFSPVFDSSNNLAGIVVCEYDAQTSIDQIDALSKELIIICITCTIISSIIIFVIILVVMRNINNINNKLKNLASNEGDLSRTIIMSSNDELHEFANHINDLISYIKNIITDINHNSHYIIDIVNLASTDISHLNTNIADSNSKMQNINRSIYDISNSVTNLNTATTNILLTINNTHKKLNDALNYSMSIKKHAEQSRSSSVNKKTSAINSIMILSNNLKEKIEASKKIHTISTLANDIISITDETNLLAINASIKAAHAKDNGKGFVVIADEISKLAISTESSAKEIQNTITSIIDVINDLSNSLTNMLEFINEETETVFTDLVTTSAVYFNNSEQLSDILQSFSNSTYTLGDRLNDVQNNIKEIDSIIIDTKTNLNILSIVSNNISDIINSIDKKILLTSDIGTNISEDIQQFKL